MSTPDANGWMPIESAPKDGTEVLLWRPRTGKALPVTGFWSHWNRWWTTGEVDRFHDHVPMWAPTHWQPLPGAPVA